MPTYKHINKENTPLNYTIKDYNNNNKPTNLIYNKTIQTLYYYDDIDNLLLLSHDPYFNPLLQQDIIVLADFSDIKSINLNQSTTSVEIINTSLNILYVFFQSVSNTPPFIIPPSSTRNLTNFYNHITQLVFKSSDTIINNEVFVTQLEK